MNGLSKVETPSRSRSHKNKNGLKPIGSCHLEDKHDEQTFNKSDLIKIDGVLKLGRQARLLEKMANI